MPSITGNRKLIKYLRHSKRKKPQYDPLPSYKERSNTLKDLGYSSYSDYLKSDEWSTIRRYFLGTHPTCLVCSKKSQQIRHLAYDARTLLGLEDMNLVALCESCHYLIEFDSHDRKRDLPEVNSTLLSMCSTPSQMLWAKKWKDFVKQQQGKTHKDKQRSHANAKNKANQIKREAKERQTQLRKYKKLPPKTPKP